MLGSRLQRAARGARRWCRVPGGAGRRGTRPGGGRSPTGPTTPAASATSCRPAQNGLDNAADLAALHARPARCPPHWDDQQPLYDGLLYALARR